MDNSNSHSKNKTLAVFHSYKMSFASWQKAGILTRELFLYRALKPHFKKIIFATYADDIESEQALAGGDFEVVHYKNHKALADADILHVNQMSGMMAAGSIKKMWPDKKLVVRCGFMWSRFQQHHNIFKKWYVSRIERWAFSIADRIVLTSRADAKYAMARYGADQSKITIIRNLIDTDLFKSSVISHQSKRICAVGRLGKQKNYESLILALKNSDYQLDIFGQGELREKFERLATDNNVRVNFRGVIPNSELAQAIAHYAVFVLPSHYEGNPKALLEAMSAGLPVIASDIEHHRDIITSGQNGLLCGRNPESIRKAIDQVMMNNELAQKLGQRARQWILDNCSTEIILQQEIKLYESLYA